MSRSIRSSTNAAPTNPTHYCHALKCEVPVDPKMLMCLAHWRTVPGDLKKQVGDYYRPGQEIDKKPSLNYMSAALCAIFAVADREKIPYDPQAIIRQAGESLARGKSKEEIERLINQSQRNS